MFPNTKDGIVRIGLIARILRHYRQTAADWAQKDDPTLRMLRRLEDVIRSHRNVPFEALISILERELRGLHPIRGSQRNEDIRVIDDATRDEIVEMIEKGTVSRSILLYIAEHKLKIPTGNLKRMRGEEVRQELQNFLKSGRSLEVVARLAGADRTQEKDGW